MHDSTRFQRLCGLCELWGAVKYFHPYLAYKEIDWDLALAETLPLVNTATSSDEYRAAIDHLLLFLEDPNTSTIRSGAPGGREDGVRTPQPFLRWMDDDVAVVVATDYDQFLGAWDKRDRFRDLFGEAAGARALVFDLRRQPLPPFDPAADLAEIEIKEMFLEAFPVLIEQDLPIATSRHRMHSGYAPQPAEPGTYYSALVTQEGQVIGARGPAGTQRPMAFLVNEGTSSANVWGASFSHLLGGLQSAGLAAVVQEGQAAREGGIDSFVMSLPDGVFATVRLTELLNPDGTIGFQPDIVVPRSSGERSDPDSALLAALEALRDVPVSQRTERRPASVFVPPRPEKAYREMAYPSREYRLLALFRFWNVIHWFFPYKRLMDQRWEAVLPEFIPRMEAAGDALDYVLTVAELVACIQDTHGTIDSPLLDAYFGEHHPPIEVGWIEGQTVVTQIGDEALHRSSSLSVGDVILSVDGEGIEDRRLRLGRLIAASTPGALQRDIHARLLGGPEGSDARLTARDRHGEVREVVLARGPAHEPAPSARPAFCLLPEGFGYIDMGQLRVEAVDEAFETIQDAPGIVIDLRRGVGETMWEIGPRLTDREVLASWAELGDLVCHGAMDSELTDPEGLAARREHPKRQVSYPPRAATYSGWQTVKPSPKPGYRGKVVALINATTQSGGEQTCLMLEAATDVTFVGSETAGTNGNVSRTILPGGIGVRFTGVSVRHADGRPLQRVGIQPHVRVEPTIEGVRGGRDEVLEAAIAFLQQPPSPVARRTRS